MNAEAWFLYDAESGRRDLVRETFELGAPSPDEVIVEPLYGAWEGNTGHAVARRPIDVCRQRKEPRVVLGSAGVVRVAERGANVDAFREGDLALVYSGCELDPYGYPTKIWGYDAPASMGCLATRVKTSPKNLVAIPKGTKHSLAQWAAFSVRYVAGWSNWSLAQRTYRLLVSVAQDPAPHVWGWGGGTTFASLDLGRRAGWRATMLSGDPDRLATIRSAGIDAVDRTQFGDLRFDADAFASDGDVRRRYMKAENAFLDFVREHTGGRGVQIFVDNIGGPLLRVTMRALSREGILATCGWKEGMQVSYLRALACIQRQQHVSSHYATYAEATEAVSFAEENGWLPPVRGPVCAFDDIPRLAQAFAEGRTEMFPVYAINGA